MYYEPPAAFLCNGGVDNAIKYTGEGGSVHLSVDLQGDCVVLAVRDSGFGLSEEQQTRIFEEFYRVRSKQTATIPGTGLGLALVKRLVEMHAGRILVESAPDKGSTFRVILALHNGASPTVEA
jgi:signal transduction histidine kinase